MVVIKGSSIWLVWSSSFLLAEDFRLAIRRDLWLMILFVKLNQTSLTVYLWNYLADVLKSGS